MSAESMIAMENTGTMSVTRSHFMCFLHIAALNAFAVAQPVFDRLSSNPEYLRLQGYSGIAITVSLAVFLLAIPVGVTVCVAVMRLCHRPKVAAALFVSAATLLAALIINLALRWLQWKFCLRGAGVPDFLIAVISLPLATGCAWVYLRFQWPRQLLSIAAIGVVLFPLNLLATPAMRVEILGIDHRESAVIRAQNPAPIVMIVFDGLCAMSLLDEHHDVDEIRYPSFARLATRSTFYRNATSVHCRTSQAVPAILTGLLPDAEKTSPVAGNYPDNLFRLIHATDEYEMTVFEPVTRLCPTELRVLSQKLSLSEQVSQLTLMLAQVYFVTTAPTDLEFLQPSIPRIWFGFVPVEYGQELPTKGLLMYGWDSEHELQVNHFVRTLEKTNKPGFHFLHIVTPHDPWTHFPSGKTYLKHSTISERTAGTSGNLGELWGADELAVHQGWQRYLLQLQYADRCLGQILDRLEEIDEFDRSLIVVVADHGMAFVPGEERRIPSNRTLVDIMSVPLFIKYPQQEIGQTNDRNVETIDVLPTVADIIQLLLPAAVDGVSLVAGNSQERPRKTMMSEKDQVTVINPDFSQRFTYVDRMVSVFGTGGHDDRMWSQYTIPELIGVELTACQHGDTSRWKCKLLRGGEHLNAESPGFVPSYFFGHLTGPTIEEPVQIAVALDGRIVATTRTSSDSAARDEWTTLIPDELWRTDENTVQLFEVEQNGNGAVLYEITY